MADKKDPRLFNESIVPAKAGSDRLFDVSYEGGGGPVECLGMTFASDDERREHFLGLLREKLQDPEFRKIEGFPIGSDEDILALSDPPYYTACPNPFLAEFIERHGQPYSAAESYDRKPLATDITEGKRDAIYNAHPYHTKVPPKALVRLLLHYTNPGDVVLDAFAGSGMLGVAASLCADPASHLGSFSGEAGTRYAILSDISPLATSIANVNARPSASPNEFSACASGVRNKVKREYAWMYKTKHRRDGKATAEGDILYCIWSEFYECSNCSSAIRAWDAIVDRKNSRLRKSFNCPFCSTMLEKDSLRRVTETYYDSLLGKASERNKSELVWIHYKVGSSRFEKAPDADDLALLRRIDDLPSPPGIRPVKMNFRDPPWGDLYRSGYHAGVTHAHHFFTKRNLTTLGALREAALQTPMPQAMLFVLTGFVDNHASKRNRYLIDRHHSAGTTCGPLSNSLYIPELQCEVNPFNTWDKTAKKQKSSFAIARPSASAITTEASRLSHVPDKSIDYVFIDPPFGQNIFYAESSFCWEYFLGVFTNSGNEAIISKYSGKGIDEYRKLICQVFAECHRVLKPGRWMTVEFSNRSNAVWNALSEAIQVAGFVIADVRVFDKKQGTIRQDMGQSIRKDLIISAYRPSGVLEERFAGEAGTEEGVWDFVRTHLRQLPVAVVDDSGKSEMVAERFRPLLFDRMIAFHVQRSVTVPLSAGEFQAGLAQRFAERDGMYFLPDQVVEYDR
ncbi:DNA methylase, partial [Candidatus Bathyarchaeota archaeon]|nr:DNA methylase [Candidatus Bathyarchaeota archaeon]